MKKVAFSPGKADLKMVRGPGFFDVKDSEFAVFLFFSKSLIPRNLALFLLGWNS